MIVSTDRLHRNMPLVLAVPCTRSAPRAQLLWRVFATASDLGLPEDGYLLVEQTRVLAQERLRKKVGHVPAPILAALDAALADVFALGL